MKKSILWTILRLFPFIVLTLFMLMRIGQGTVQYASQVDFYQDITDYSTHFRFKPVYDFIKNALQQTNLLTQYTQTSTILANLISYEILITLVHIAYSVFEFFPRFCISIFERKMKK